MGKGGESVQILLYSFLVSVLVIAIQKSQDITGGQEEDKNKVCVSSVDQHVCLAGLEL